MSSSSLPEGGQGTPDRLQLLEDKLDLQELCVRYGRLLDAGRLEEWASLFTEDGVLDLGPFGRPEGRAALVATMRTILAAAPATTHVIGAPTVRVDVDEATGECNWVALQPGAGGTRVARAGRHRDRFRRTADGWRIVERRGFQDLPLADG